MLLVGSGRGDWSLVPARLDCLAARRYALQDGHPEQEESMCLRAST